MLHKNDEIIIDIEDFTADGSGIGRYDGMAVFVPLTAVGDRVKVKILKIKKTYAYGKIAEIVSPAECRAENDCLSFEKCGGCVFRHISFDAELEAKTKKVYDAVKRIGGIDMPPEPIIYDSEYRYRNKAQYPVNCDGDVGFYAFHSHRIIPCGDCLLQPEIFSRLTNTVSDWAKEKEISIYDETVCKGLLRHIYIRQAPKTEEIMLVAVINGRFLPFEKELIQRLLAVAGDKLKSVQLNINTDDTNVILGDECICIYGEPYITDILCGVKVRLSALSFYQVNSVMAEKLYLKAAEYAEPYGKNVLDLYCGAGTIGLSMAKSAKSIIGVEIIPEAVKDAEFNAEQNGIKNARFLCADAADAAQKLAEENTTVNTVIVDPPRKGCSAELIDVITEKFCPERIVYVSCDPATLARDIKLFCQNGYTLNEYTPANLFPRTAHIETVVLMSRR